jgi:hypothetical protein
MLSIELALVYFLYSFGFIIFILLLQYVHIFPGVVISKTQRLLGRSFHAPPKMISHTLTTEEGANLRRGRWKISPIPVPARSQTRKDPIMVIKFKLLPNVTKKIASKLVYFLLVFTFTVGFCKSFYLELTKSNLITNHDMVLGRWCLGVYIIGSFMHECNSCNSYHVKKTSIITYLLFFLLVFTSLNDFLFRWT